MLSPKYRLKKEMDFKRIYRKGKINRGFFFDCLYLKSDKEPRFGIITTTKSINKAVKRNKAKRQVRGLIRKNKKDWPKNNDIIIKIKKIITNQELTQAETELQNIFKTIKNNDK